MTKPRVLTIAGSDSGGGAGIQADIKTITALGGYAMSAITALTAQDTTRVHGVVAIEPAFVALQLRVVIADLGVDAIKTGMLVDSRTIAAVIGVLDELVPEVPIVVDPVMVATSGAALLDPHAIASLRTLLLPRAAVFTPNLPEAEALLGRRIDDRAGMVAAAETLFRQGAAAVLVKGGHLPGEIVADVLATQDGIRIFEAPRLPGGNTHGTGCTLASAIAVGIARGWPVATAIIAARDYVRRAIAAAPGFGHGDGPLDHGVAGAGFGDPS